MTELISCKHCGNKEYFVEVVTSAMGETRWVQDMHGAWSNDGSDWVSNDGSDTQFWCNSCGTEMTDQHEKFIGAI